MPHSPTLVDHPPIPPPLIRANSGVSLYQACLNLMDRLSGVPDFEQYLDPELLMSVQEGSPSTMSVNDPVSQLWVLFRLGTPLACIFNGLRPTKPLEVNNTNLTLSNINTCKASVFRFLVGCRQELQFKDEDLFTISELYQDDTNGFVKVTNNPLHLQKAFLHTTPIVSLSTHPSAPHHTRTNMTNMNMRWRCSRGPDHDCAHTTRPTLVPSASTHNNICHVFPSVSPFSLPPL